MALSCARKKASKIAQLKKSISSTTEQGDAEPFLTFMLYTGRPGTYAISGYVSYRDKATGLTVSSKRVSPGAVTFGSTRPRSARMY